MIFDFISREYETKHSCSYGSEFDNVDVVVDACWWYRELILYLDPVLAIEDFNYDGLVAVYKLRQNLEFEFSSYEEVAVTWT